MSVGLYRNRGCEAIVRGTMEILRREFGPEVSVRAGVGGGNRDTVMAQIASEIDPAVEGFPVCSPGGPRWSSGWLAAKINQRFGTAFQVNRSDIKQHARATSIALQVGGDTYSLEYGRPVYYMVMDRFLQSCGRSVVLWAASVGPFEADPKFAPEMFAHLRSLSAVFVRESDSYNYLRAHGVSENVHLMADPAFVMKPAAPSADKIGFALPEGAIGINLSPMVAFYRGLSPATVNLKDWMTFCVSLVKCAAGYNRPILLIPHVSSADPGNDDFALLDAVCKAVAPEVQVPVQVLPEGLNAAELKWIIARCAIFAGARTHSTIAALSSEVPTLSIAYSLKAKGINRDVYGHLDHCIHVADLTAENFTTGLRVLLTNESAIRAQLHSRIPELQARAWAAGGVLRRLCAPANSAL